MTLIGPETDPLRVLIIDDEAHVRQSIGAFLDDLEYEPVYAENGAQGIELFQNTKPDAILCDLKMPEIDGFDVIRQVRQESPETPIIVVSGAGRVEDAIKAVRLGAWDFITKPIHDLGVLEHALVKALERATLLQENRLYRERLEELVHKRTLELQAEVGRRRLAQEELSILNQELEERVATRTRELEGANASLSRSLQELKQAQSRLVQSEKMAALGGLVAGVAHEINTPVGAAITGVSFLEDKTSQMAALHRVGELKRSQFEKHLHIAEDTLRSVRISLDRAAHLIRSFKEVAVDQTSGKKRRYNFKQYLDEILLSLKPVYGRTSHSIHVDCPGDLFMHGDPGSIMQIISNLIENALLHGFERKEHGEIRIRVETNDDSSSLVLSDNGRGMTPEERDKVFEPFYTTKRGHGGTGLGMHIVYNLVVQTLGGAIFCDSVPGQGTVFTITIPLTEKPANDH